MGSRAEGEASGDTEEGGERGDGKKLVRCCHRRVKIPSRALLPTRGDVTERGRFLARGLCDKEAALPREPMQECVGEEGELQHEKGRCIPQRGVWWTPSLITMWRMPPE